MEFLIFFEVIESQMNKNTQEVIEQGAKERRRGYRGWHLKRTKSEKTDTHQDQKEEKELTKELSYRSQEGKKMFLKGVDVVKPCKWNFEKPLKRREDAERK